MKKIVYTLFAALALPACHFLEVDQVGKSDIDTYFSEVGALEPAMYGVYSLMNSFYERYMLTYPEVAGDLVYLSGQNTEWDRQYNFSSRYEDETTAVGYIWKSGYNIIQNTNYIIRHAPDLRDGRSARIVDNVLAQAYFVRALIHFDLCRTYAQTYTYTPDASHPGVPVMTHTPGIHEKMVRNTVKEVYDQIIKDLEKALDLFDSQAFNEYLASPDACKALMARVFLYMEDYEKAATLSKELTDRFGLESRDRYRSMFNTVGTRGKEGIFRLSNLNNSKALASFYRYENPSGRPSGKLKSLFKDSRDVRLTLFRHNAYSDALKMRIEYDDVNMKYDCTDSLAENLKHYDPFLFRSAEMYLIHGEASCKRGDLSAAAADLRILEARALGIPEGEVVLDTDDAGRMMELIEEERMKELCFEGHRLFDIARWHGTLSRDAETTANIRTLRFPDYRFVLPIPQIEMESNDHMIQNPDSNE